MVVSGYVTPANKIVVAGHPLIQELKVESATEAYPGRVVMRGTNDDDIKVTDGIGVAIGFLGYENTFPAFMPTNIRTAYAANDQSTVLSGAQTVIFMPSGLALGTVATKKQLVAPWSKGQVVPIKTVGGKNGIVIPFSKSATDKKTGVVVPAGMVVTGGYVEVTTEAEAATIDVGFDGDSDAFLDGISLAAKGNIPSDLVNTTAANITLGDSLVESDIKTADGTALYVSIPAGYTVPAGGKEIAYKTSDATVAGNIVLFLESPGFFPIGAVEKSVSAASAAADLQIKSLI